MSQTAAALSAAVDADDRIPVLDVGAFLAGAPGALESLARRVEATCRDTGFLVIANHGVPQALIDRTFAQASAFFDRPMDEKMAVRRGQLNIGYMPVGGQTLRTSTINVNTKPNLSESFYVTHERAADDPDILAKKPLIGRNRWPADMPAFRADIIDYFETMERVSLSLLPLFAAALDLPPDYFAPDVSPPQCTLRLIRYQPQEAAHGENVFGFAPHTDNNLITFLPQSNVPGLEVRTSDGTWIRPPRVPGTFVVNTGEVLARYSNDRFKPTPHRVINQSGVTRHAIPFFLGPDYDAVIRCAPTCVGPDNPPRYEPTTQAELALHRLRNNFTNSKPDADGVESADY